MDGLARSIRLVIGLALIASGTSLAAPAGLQLAAWWQTRQAPSLSPAGGTTAPPRGFTPGVPAAGTPPSPPPPAEWPDAAWPPAPPPTAGFVPPVPPVPLPPVAAGLAAAPPDLAAAYRTTLAPPPPPLLDGQRPPPLSVGWTVRGGEVASGTRRTIAVAAPPATYRVRDGDDLTAIATRLYGTPAAAGMIWEVNRGVLGHPAILPIGAELTLPPPDAVAAITDGSRRRSIEPPAGEPASARPGPAPASASWLDGR